MVQVITDRSDIPATGKVVIDFFAAWCGPCKGIAPKLEVLEKEFPNITILKVDVDDSEELAGAYDVSVLPTFLFLHNGAPVARIEGANLAQLIAEMKTLESLA